MALGTSVYFEKLIAHSAKVLLTHKSIKTAMETVLYFKIFKFEFTKIEFK